MAVKAVAFKTDCFSIDLTHILTRLFPYDYYRHSLDFTLNELARSMFITGKIVMPQNLTRNRQNEPLIWEFIGKYSLAQAYFRRNSKTANLMMTPLARSLDDSEVRFISYYLGQAMAGIYCYHKMGIRQLLHVSRYGGYFGVKFDESGRRPDLFGFNDCGDSVIVEAKGSTRAYPSVVRRLIYTAIDQLSAVTTVKWRAPDRGVVCIAAFETPMGPMQMFVVPLRGSDITWKEQQVDDSSVDPTIDRLMYLYYNSMVAVLESNLADGVEDDEKVIQGVNQVSLPQIGLVVGLDSDIVAVVRETSLENLDGVGVQIERILERSDPEGRGLFLDGTQFDADGDFEPEMDAIDRD